MTVTLLDTLVHSRYPRVYEYKVTGASGDQLVYTPSAGNRVWVVGMCMTEASAIDFVFKTDTKSISLELGAHQAVVKDLANGILFFGKVGEAFSVNTGTDLSEAIIWVVEAEHFAGWFG